MEHKFTKILMWILEMCAYIFTFLVFYLLYASVMPQLQTINRTSAILILTYIVLTL